ncbi:MAG TPA: ParB/RepB/Spo0J family partition protein [Gemmataceae bacterium]|jgi:ParB family chromosome partitioning protein
MAMQLNAGEIGRADLFSILPENIVVNEAENGRAVPHSQEEIEALANSILTYGQQQPVVVRRIEDKKVALVSGYGRYKAVSHINRVLRLENPVKLQCKVVDCNPEEAFVRNIVENNERAATTPVDDAHNQRRLREEFGWTEQRIADFYKRSVAYISQLRKTLQLSQPIQQAVAKGNMAVSAALDLVELTEAARQKAVAEATDQASGKVDSEVIRKKVRDKKIENGQAKARTMREVRTFFESQGEPGPIRELAESILDFLAGKITDRQMRHALENVCQFSACEPAAHS